MGRKDQARVTLAISEIWSGGGWWSLSLSQAEMFLLLADGLGAKYTSALAPGFFKYRANLGKRQPPTTPHSGHTWHWGHCSPSPWDGSVSVGLRGCLNACACLVGSDVNSVDFVDSGSAMRKTVARQNAKLEGGSSKPDFVIWEIEVPKVTSCWPAHHPALPYTATSWSSWSGAGSVPSLGDQQQVQEDWGVLLLLGLQE